MKTIHREAQEAHQMLSRIKTRKAHEKTPKVNGCKSVIETIIFKCPEQQAALFLQMAGEQISEALRSRTVCSTFFF